MSPRIPAATPRAPHELHHENGNTGGTGPFHCSEDAAGPLRSRPLPSSDAYVKEGGLSAGWIHELGGVTELALS
ncbi:hypothetical protein [Streptomyces albipurpureus]|uniref:Uncharacterized protein n=1 Tax=Streptomyces albipurpureus TaxID=2897419 RepID=A0ABT0UYY9_9ACTN|nr:hypothetical protein [Streptomyces sp. CWNU-1]MCM2393662.1 hypothetical protein [Streptomyces sp. CWNU-1]